MNMNNQQQTSPKKHKVFIFSTRELGDHENSVLFNEKLNKDYVLIKDEVSQNAEYNNFRLKYNKATRKDYFINYWLKKVKENNNKKQINEMKNIIYKQIIDNKATKNMRPNFYDKMTDFVYKKIIGNDEKARDEQIRGYLSDDKLKELFKDSEYFATYSYLDIHKYYKIITEKNDEIFAIPLLIPDNLEIDKGKEWITAILDEFKDKNNQETEYFLLLHDKDLFEYNGQDLYILSQNEIDNLIDRKKVNIKKENVNILVFQHSSNSVTNILRKPYEKDTADKIENIFYKKRYLNEITQYCDDHFNGEEIKKKLESPEHLKYKLTEEEKKRIEISVNSIPDNILQIIRNSYFLTKEEDTDKEKKSKPNLYVIENCKVHIMIHDMFPFNKSPDIRKTLEGVYLFGQDNYTLTEKELYPTIHISLFNFFSNTEVEQNDFDEKIRKDYMPCLPRYVKVIDSNIWNYYVPYHKFNDTSSFKERLRYAIDEIHKNYAIGLYSTNNAKEKAEFTKRLVENSYIHSIGGHGKNVAPFVFHSEAEMQKKTIMELDELNKKEDLNWRFLIVDDHASKQSIKDKPNIVPKCEIIYRLLAKYFNIECHKCKYGNDTDKADAKKCCERCHPNNSHAEDKKITIWFDCAITMEEAIKKLSETKYDLILMDYLLDTNEETKNRNYAYDLLNKISDRFKYKVKKENGKEEEKWEIKNNRIGPNGKLQMFYISAFASAVSERMLERGLNYDSEYWHISHGACPTTTPYLFLFYLLKRMNTQIKSFTKLSKKEKLKDQLENVTTLLDLLLIIYKEKPRERAIEHFNSLLKLRLNYDNLKYDVCDAGTRCKEKLPIENASLLISSLFPDISYYDSAFWEHTMHLVYLTAYGTIRQWHDMWEEFMLIKPCLQKICDENENANYGLTAKDVVTAIEKYIISLQNQSR